MDARRKKWRCPGSSPLLLAAAVGTCIKMRAGLERIQRWLACASDPDANKSIKKRYLVH